MSQRQHGKGHSVPPWVGKDTGPAATPPPVLNGWGGKAAMRSRRYRATAGALALLIFVSLVIPFVIRSMTS